MRSAVLLLALVACLVTAEKAAPKEAATKDVYGSTYDAGYASSSYGSGYGYDASYGSGYDASYSSGYDASYGSGYDASYGSGYDASYGSGYATYDSYGKGYGYESSGYDASYGTGYDASYGSGYDASYGSGYDASYGSGYDASYGSGYDASYGSGYDASYGSGYDASYGSGYDASYGSGYDASYGSGYATYDSYGKGYGYESSGYDAPSYGSYDKGWDQGYNSANVDYNSADSYAGADPDDYGKGYEAEKSGYNTGYGSSYDASYNAGYGSGYGADASYGSYDAASYGSYNAGYGSGYGSGYGYGSGSSYSAAYGAYGSVPADTREGCPPKGFTALSEKQDLSKLAPGGQYAICQTPVQDDMSQTMITDPFQWNHSGIFRLRDSKLLVDNNIQVNIHYPGRLEWTNVVVTQFPEGDENGDGDFGGFNVYGAYEPGNPKSDLKKGFCGKFDRVRLDGVDRRQHSLAMRNCSSMTTFKTVSVYDGNSGFYFEDCYGIIGYDLVGASDLTGWDGIVATRSHLSFIRPQLYSDRADGIIARDGSSLTICDAFLETDFGDNDYVIGGESDDKPSVIAVAGLTNSHFPENIDFIGEGGLLYTLAKCPKVLKSTYNMKEWTSYYTPENQLGF